MKGFLLVLVVVVVWSQRGYVGMTMAGVDALLLHGGYAATGVK